MMKNICLCSLIKLKLNPYGVPENFVIWFAINICLLRRQQELEETKGNLILKNYK